GCRPVATLGMSRGEMSPSCACKATTARWPSTGRGGAPPGEVLGALTANGLAAALRGCSQVAGAVQLLVANPVEGAAQSVLAPGRVVLGRQSCPLEMVQPPHRQRQPVFALLDHAV